MSKEEQTGKKAENTAKQEAKREEQEAHVAEQQARNDPVATQLPVEEEQSREQRLHDMGGAPINKG